MYELRIKTGSGEVIAFVMPTKRIAHRLMAHFEKRYGWLGASLLDSTGWCESHGSAIPDYPAPRARVLWRLDQVEEI